MCHDHEEWCKIWRRIDLSFENPDEEFYNLTRVLKSKKTCTLMGPF